MCISPCLLGERGFQKNSSSRCGDRAVGHSTLKKIGWDGASGFARIELRLSYIHIHLASSGQPRAIGLIPRHRRALRGGTRCHHAPESDPENSLLLKFSRVYPYKATKIMACRSPSMVRRNRACRRLFCDDREPAAGRAAFSRAVIRLVASQRCSALQMCSQLVVVSKHS